MRTQALFHYEEVERMFTRMSVMMVHDGKIEFPTSAVVNGELVTQYGAGVDSWRVHEGKITDHWDASPAVAVSLSAHDQSFSDRMQKQIDLGVRLPGGPEVWPIRTRRPPSVQVGMHRYIPCAALCCAWA